jgi:hypothetical protein
MGNSLIGAYCGSARLTVPNNRDPLSPSSITEFTDLRHGHRPTLWPAAFSGFWYDLRRCKVSVYRQNPLALALAVLGLARVERWAPVMLIAELAGKGRWAFGI